MRFDKYINIPFVDGGRDFTGLDCYGLVCLMFKEERKVELPDFLELNYEPDWAKHGKNHILENIDENWMKVNDGRYKRFDCHIFFDEEGIASHVGIEIGDGKFLHVLDGREVQIGKMDIWKHRYYGTMRWIGAESNI